MKKSRTIAIIFFLCIGFITYKANINEKFWVESVYNIPHYDKIGHFVVYGILALLLNHTFNYHSIYAFGRFPIRTSVIVVMTFCLFEEFSQRMFASRTFDLMDLAFDAAGIILFSYVNNTGSFAITLRQQHKYNHLEAIEIEKIEYSRSSERESTLRIS